MKKRESQFWVSIGLLLFILALFILASTVLMGCSKGKNRECYECQLVSGGVLKKEKVCTEGNPEAELPEYDNNGRLHWDCKRK